METTGIPGGVVLVLTVVEFLHGATNTDLTNRTVKEGRNWQYV